MAYVNLPQAIAAAVGAVREPARVFLLVINVVLLFVGVFMDMTPAILIFTPIFLPIVRSSGWTRCTSAS